MELRYISGPEVANRQVEVELTEEEAVAVRGLYRGLAWQLLRSSRHYNVQDAGLLLRYYERYCTGDEVPSTLMTTEADIKEQCNFVLRQKRMVIELAGGKQLDNPYLQLYGALQAEISLANTPGFIPDTLAEDFQ